VIFLLKKILKKKKRTLQEHYPEYDIGIESYGKPKILSWGHNVRLRIGAYCSFAPGVQILLGGNHRMDWVTTFPLYLSYELPNFTPDEPSKPDDDITIGNDV